MQITRARISRSSTARISASIWTLGCPVATGTQQRISSGGLARTAGVPARRHQPQPHVTAFLCRVTDTSCPVFFRLPALPVELVVTFSSNSPPIFWLHPTQTSVSGMTSSRSGGISTPHTRHRFVVLFISSKRSRTVRAAASATARPDHRAPGPRSSGVLSGSSFGVPSRSR